MTVKSETEINAEKADYITKPALDVVPAELPLAAGRALGYGKAKHGVATPDGWGTWRIAGTQQAEPLVHYACLLRHMLLWRAGELNDAESGLSHLDHAAAQLAILLDLQARPVVGARLVEAAVAAACDPDNDEDWSLPEGWRWDLDRGTWYAEDPENGGSRCPDINCCDDPPDVCAIVRARNGVVDR